MKSSLFVALQILSFLIVVVAFMGCAGSPFEIQQTLTGESTSEMHAVRLFGDSNKFLSIAKVFERY